MSKWVKAKATPEALPFHRALPHRAAHEIRLALHQEAVAPSALVCRKPPGSAGIGIHRGEDSGDLLGNGLDSGARQVGAPRSVGDAGHRPVRLVVPMRRADAR